MLIFPAIDIVDGKAVRLFKGDYAQMTVYSENPVSVAKDFEKAGAKWVHLVDLEGAKNGDTPNLETVCKIVRETNLKVEIGGGIRSLHGTIFGNVSTNNSLYAEILHFLAKLISILFRNFRPPLDSNFTVF